MWAGITLVGDRHPHICSINGWVLIVRLLDSGALINHNMSGQLPGYNVLELQS